MQLLTIAATFIGFVVSVIGDNVIRFYKNNNWVGIRKESGLLLTSTVCTSHLLRYVVLYLLLDLKRLLFVFSYLLSFKNGRVDSISSIRVYKGYLCAFLGKPTTFNLLLFLFIS